MNRPLRMLMLGFGAVWALGAVQAESVIRITRQGETVARIRPSALRAQDEAAAAAVPDVPTARELAATRRQVFGAYGECATALAEKLRKAETMGEDDGALRAALAAFLAHEGPVAGVHRQTEAFLRAHQSDAQILLRHQATAQRFEAYLENVREAVTTMLDDGRPGAAANALAVLGATGSVTEQKALGPEPEPEPEPGTAPVSAAMESEPAGAGPLPAGGSGSGAGAPGPEFLAETPEIVFTQEIVDRAAALGNDPIRIYEFVRNEVANQLYPGSRKGAAETLRQRGGNDTDQASLLIALLRAAGVPSRYVQASVDIPVEAFESWWASKDIESVRATMSAEGMNGSLVQNGAAVRKTHIYVEAYVPYGKYRGTGQGDTEPIWVRLDPSFALHQIDDGSDYVDDLDFDVDIFFADHIAGFTALTPIEAFEAEIQAWLDVNQPGSAVADGLRVVDPVPQALGLLPASLPYDIVTENAAFAELFDQQRYKIRFELVGTPGTLLDHTVLLSEVAGKVVTLDYLGATPADQATIDSFDGIYNTPPDLVDVLARLKAGGTLVTTGVVAVGSARDVTLILHFIQPNGGFNAEPVNSYALVAGSANAWSFDPFTDEPAAPDFSLAVEPDAMIESLLEATVTGYQRMRNEGIRRLIPLVGASVQYDVRPNRALNALQVLYSAGAPVEMTWLGLQVDIDERGRFNHDAALRTGIRANSFSELYGVLDGMQSSILENRVFEDQFSRDAVSTIKILQLASDQGIPLCTITSSVGAECPGFSHPAYVLAEVNNRIAAGRTVTIPRDPITVDNWTGTGYSALSGGGGGYLIQGAVSPPIEGGATVDYWEEDFTFVDCQTSRIFRATIVTPPADAPHEEALFVASADPLTFALSLLASCDGTLTTQVFEFATGIASRDYPTGSYELQVGGETRKFAIIQGDLWVDSNNDVSKNIFDEPLEDTEPFVFWVNDDDNGNTNADKHRVFSPDFNPQLAIAEWDFFDDKINGFFDLMDVAPLALHLDKGTLDAFVELGIQLELRAEGLQYFRSSGKNTRDGRLFLPTSYWFDEEAGLDQISQPMYDDGGADGTLLLDLADVDGTNWTWLVFEGTQESTPGQDTIQLVAYGPSPSQAVVLDEVMIKIMHLKDMYRSVSVRGAQTPATYETEVTAGVGTLRTTTVNQYPTTFTSDYGGELWNSDHVLVFVHGFNNTANDAEAAFHNLFRKLYLNEYRGEFITFKWEGDEVAGPDPRAALYFDFDVENAFESSKGLMNLIQELKAGGKTIDIAAHSLGNLVVLDALRRLALSHPGTAFVRNIIHIEAAVWNGHYLGRPLPDGGDYTALEAEQRATWDHWSADVPGHVTGTIVNSYNGLDGALVAMYGNDQLAFRIRGPQPPWEEHQFDEWATITQDYRTPDRLAFDIPGDPHTNDVSFTRYPMGTGPIPQTQANFPQQNFDAGTYNWGLISHSGYREEPLHRMWRWYRDVMIEYTGPGN